MGGNIQIDAASLRGLSRLAIDAVEQMTHLVEAMHLTIVKTPGVLGASPTGSTSGITGLVYRSIRGVNALVGSSLETLLDGLQPMLGSRNLPPAGAAGLAALNGVLGDYLEETGNPLAIPMRMRRAGTDLIIERDALAKVMPAPRSKLVILVHGLCMNDQSWSGSAAATDAEDASAESDLVERLQRERGYEVVHLNYNSGRHISTNGREFADLLERLLANWPAPIDELVLIGHSLGGLVSRSACHYAEAADHDWVRQLRSLVFLGTPHHGAPLERGGNGVDVLLNASPYTAPFARLGKMRSAGITDLRYGNLIDEDWLGRDRFARSGDVRAVVPLPSAVRCHALAATTGKQSGDMRDRLLGDGLVPVSSALGHHDEARRRLAFAEADLWIGHGIGHIDLLTHPEVHAEVLRRLT